MDIRTMAKVGLNYYTIDTDRYLDLRIKRLKKNLGCVGVAVYDYVLCEVYRVNGCYLIWNDDQCFDVAEYFALKESTVDEVVRYCGVVGLFDKELLSRGIITSESIQRRFLEMSKRAKREVEIPEEIQLFREKTEKLREKTPILPEETEIFPEKIGQKKSKEKKSKEKSVCENAHTRTREEILFEDFIKWASQYARLSLAFTEPLTVGNYMWLHTTYGVEKIKECASDLHAKEAYKTNRNAMNAFKRWIVKLC